MEMFLLATIQAPLKSRFLFILSIDSLAYLYDAAGIKLQQATYKDGLLVETTDYVGEYIYVNGELQLLQHEEGRIVRKDNEVIIYQEDGTDASAFDSKVGEVALRAKVLNNENYIQVTSQVNNAGRQMAFWRRIELEGQDTIRILAKGYATSKTVFRIVTVGLNEYYNYSLPRRAENEDWVEFDVALPNGATYIYVVMYLEDADIGDAVYLNDFKVVRPALETVYDYQYHLKDHLGNVRLTFSTTPENYTEIQDMESMYDTANDPARATKFVNIPYRTDEFASTSGNEVATLDAGETGVMILIGVQKRDTLRFSVQANYMDNQSSNGLTDIVANMVLNAYNTGVPASQVLEPSTVTPIQNGLDQMVNTTGLIKDNSSDLAPRAYLNYIYFNEDMTYNRAGYAQVSSAANGLEKHELLELDLGAAEVDGYVLAYLTNETKDAVSVNFDDFTVYHGKTNVVSTQDYYPFGLTFNSYTRTASSPQKYKFNGKEEIEEIRTYDFGQRMYDKDLGRFWQVDPLAMIFQSYSPYQYALNNPIRFEDWEGMGPGDRVKIAKSYIGTPYAQTGNTGALRRSGQTIMSGGLNHLDCSEFVYRVLEADGLVTNTGGNTANLVSEFSNDEKWIKSNSPEIGDAFLWRQGSDGHTGIVTGIVKDEEGNVTGVEITHAKGTNYGTVTEVKTLEYFTEHWGWKGFFRPIKEFRPDKIERKEGETTSEWLERAANVLARAQATAEIKRKKREAKQKERERRKKER